MAVNPVIICLSRSGAATAHKIAQTSGYAVHGRNGRVEQADAFFDNALDHVRDLFAAKVPVIGVCASGILIRAVAPLLNEDLRRIQELCRCLGRRHAQTLPTYR